MKNRVRNDVKLFGFLEPPGGSYWPNQGAIQRCGGGCPFVRVLPHHQVAQGFYSAFQFFTSGGNRRCTQALWGEYKNDEVMLADDILNECCIRCQLLANLFAGRNLQTS